MVATPRDKQSDEERIAGLIYKQNGNISAIARAMKLSRTRMYQIISESEVLKEALGDAREIQLDDAEDALGKAIKAQQGWAVCFYLKTQGKKRGFVEKEDQTISLATLARVTEELGVAVVGAVRDVELDEPTSTRLFEAIQTRWDAILLDGAKQHAKAR